MSAFNDAATCCMRVKQTMPRSMASGDSSFISPAPWPILTLSFSRAMTSNPWSTTFATTMWKLLVPMSRAAMLLLFVPDATWRAYFEAIFSERLLSLQYDGALQCDDVRAQSSRPTHRGRCVLQGRTPSTAKQQGTWRKSNGRGQRLHHPLGRTLPEGNSCSYLRSSTR